MIRNVSAEEIGAGLALHLKEHNKIVEGQTVEILEVNPDKPKSFLVVRIVNCS